MLNRSLVFTITGTSPAGAAVTATIGSVADFTTLPTDANASGLEVVDDVDIIAVVQGGTGGTLDLFLQTSPDGTTWTDWAHLTQLAAAAPSAVVRFSSCRVQQAALVTVGQNLTPALAAATVVGGPVAKQMRLVGKTGAGNTAGAVQTVTIRATGVSRPAGALG